ncbi:MAG: SlyX family protein [Polaromonas sp.]|nr:SlyX family protein [Polaromonas sp.]
MDDSTDRRLTELEIKASFAEDLLETLNQVIVQQQQQIDLLLRETRALKQLMPETSSGVAAGRPGDELPPHY